MNEGDGGVIEGGFLLLRQEAPQSIGHGVSEKKDSQKRQDQVAQENVATTYGRYFVDTFRSNKTNKSVNSRHQDDQQRNNSSDEADKNGASLLEHTNKPCSNINCNLHGDYLHVIELLSKYHSDVKERRRERCCTSALFHAVEEHERLHGCLKRT